MDHGPGWPAGSSVLPLGDRALLVPTTGIDHARRVAAALEAAGVGVGGTGRSAEVVTGFGGVAVVLAGDDGADDVADRPLAWWAAWVAEVQAGATAAGPVDPGPNLGPERDGADAGPERKEGATHVLPVVFDGTDLADVAGRLGMDADDVVGLLVGAELEVALLGFAPGFPYLVGLPEPLASLPRRSTPRPGVPAGSVAVAGGFAGIYPRSSPGGWHLLGRTPVRLFDPTTPPYSALAVGDRVRFAVAGTDGPGSGPDAAVDRIPPLPALAPDADRWLEVVDPGFLTTVQDGGRTGVARLGCPAGGTADPDARVLVNRLLGNPDGAAVLECTAAGPVLRIHASSPDPVHVAVVGADAGALHLRLDGRPVAAGTVVPVAPGQVVAVGPVARGLRAVLGVAGGLTTTEILGSRSSDLLTGLGPGPLRTGDRLPVGPPSRPRGRLALPPVPPDEAPAVLRFVPGPHGADRDAARRLADAPWTVLPASDRIGVRLDGPGHAGLTGVDPVDSLPVVTGAVQIPPDGRPIVLLPDHATLGGYPVAGCVISADLGRLGRLAPGQAVVFMACTPDEAEAARRRHQGDLAGRVSGWHPTRAGS